MFKEILETQAFSEILDYFNNQAPCSLLGFFMKLLGNCLLRHIYILKNKHIFFPYQDVLQVQLLNGGEILVTSRNNKHNIALNEQTYNKFKTNVNFLHFYKNLKISHIYRLL